MLKIIYRVIVLLGVFVASLYYFSQDIKEVVFNIDNTTIMEEATFPLVTIHTEGNRINLLHGYSTNLDANVVREAVTPITTDQTLEVYFDQEDYDIKKLNYELRNFVDNKLIETDSVSVFEDQGEERSAKIKIKSELESKKEYAVKITLITSESKKMYYYFRIKKYNQVYLEEMLSFVMDFHNTIKDKEKAEDIAKYLETDKNADNATLAYVNINSSLDLVSWGNLQPVVLTEIVPTVKEIYPDTAFIELNYFIEATVGEAKERYQVTEFYRIRYTSTRTYLLNYDRWMEALFDINQVSLAKSEFKLGISSDYEVPYIASDDQKKLAFVRNRELWFYNMEENEMIKVFSFAQEETDYFRDLYNQHDVRILNMDAEGNIDFMVYGYMNRGQYEGKVALLLYRYIRLDNRIEELVYIPAEETYYRMKDNIGDLAYVNGKETFYFHINQAIYAYNLITRELTEIATNVKRDNVVVLKELNYIVWQDSKLSTILYMMDLETEERQTIEAPTGYHTHLLGMIDQNIIYGLSKDNDAFTTLDGREMFPMSVIKITDIQKKVLKSYKKSGYFISGLNIEDNVITLNRLTKAKEGKDNSFIKTSDDFIINQKMNETPIIQVNTRVTDQALTELYLTMPSGYTMPSVPRVIGTVQTVITQDPTVRVIESNLPDTYYYAYTSKDREAAYDNAAEAIVAARDRIGVVLDNKMRLVWERGIKAPQNFIKKFEEMDWNTNQNTIISCLELILSYQKVQLEVSISDLEYGTAYDIMKEYSLYEPVQLTGTALEDALYYVSEGRPILAMKSSGKAVLIYGYDAYNIMMIDPSSNKPVRMGLQEGIKMFEEAGNIFVSYLGD